MLFRHCLLAIIIATTSLTAPALNQSVVLAQQPEIRPQVALTKDNITRFLAAYPELKTLGEKYEKDASRGSNAGQGAMDSLWGHLQSKAARTQVETIIKAHGFSNYLDWLDVARSIALAYSFAKSGKSVQQLGGQADAALAAIRSNPNLTVDQKKQMEAMVSQQMGQLNRLQPPAGNVAIAKEMESEIAAVIDRR